MIMKLIIKILLFTILFLQVNCKKEENNEPAKLKIINFNSDAVIGGKSENFLCVDYLSSSLMNINGSGLINWQKKNLFEVNDPQQQKEEIPTIKILSDGKIMLWEQIVDTFVVTSSQYFCHWKLSIFNGNGKLLIQRNVFTKDAKKVKPLNLIELSDGTVFVIGVVETNKISGAISILKVDNNGTIIWNKSINPATYWLNGVFPNEKTSIKLCANGQEVMAIVQIGIQTSCFKFDNDGNILLYKRYNYATEDGIQQQINATNFLEFPISDIQRINQNEFLITGVKYSGNDYTASNNRYYRDIFAAKINDNFEVLMSKDYQFLNYQSDIIALIDDNQTITFVSSEGEDLGGDTHPVLMKISLQNLEIINKSVLQNLINFHALSSAINSDKTVSIVGANSAFGSLSKHTFFIKTKADGSL